MLYAFLITFIIYTTLNTIENIKLKDISAEDKKIKNEQWFISDLNSKINNNNISKPKFQRIKKWDIITKKKNVPDEQSYIKFLYDTYNSVNSIKFGKTIK